MGYAEALLARDYRREREDLEAGVKKKGLWGSIGRTIGSLGVMAISGGTLNPVTLGLLTGGASFLGGALGSKAAEKVGGVDLEGGKFMKADRKSLETELGAFGTKNIVESLKGGITAGIGQATKLYRAGSRAKELGKTAEEVSKIRKGVGFGESFKESMVGKEFARYQSGQTGKELIAKGEASLGTGSKITQGDVDYSKYRKMVPEDPISKKEFIYANVGNAPDYDPSKIVRRGKDFAPGEITSKIEKASARTGMGRLGIDSKGSLWDSYSPSKVDVPEAMKPMWNKQTFKQGLERIVAPPSLYKRDEGGELYKGEREGLPFTDFWKNL